GADVATVGREVRRLLAEAHALGRTTSAGLGRIALLDGRLEEAAGRSAEALTLYLRAFELGERGEQQTHHLLQMLLDRQRLAEADRVVRHCEIEGLSDVPGAGEARFALFPLPVAGTKRLPPSLARLGCEAALRQR